MGLPTRLVTSHLLVEPPIPFIRTFGGIPTVYLPFTELVLDVVNLGALLHDIPRSQVADFLFV